MVEVVIVEGCANPIGALGGELAAVRPDDLAALVLREVLQRSQVDPAMVEEIYLGCANQAGEDNRDVARMAALLAGFPVEVAGVTLNRLCASGLAAVNQAARAIRAGEADILIAGGVESMSRAPYSVPKADQAFPYGNLTAWDTALGWRYPNPKMVETYGIESMGETAENIAEADRHFARRAGCICPGEPPPGGCGHRCGPVCEEIVPVHGAAAQGGSLAGCHRRAPAARHHPWRRWGG